MKVWFTDTNHERFHFPRLRTSLRRLKGHVQEDFREVLERFADQVEYLTNSYTGKLKEFDPVSSSVVKRPSGGDSLRG